MVRKSFIVGMALGASLLFANGADAAETYKVQSGDTLWKISQKHHISVQEIRDLNKLSTDMIYVNQSLIISPYDTYFVKAGDTLKSIGNRHGLTLTEMIKWNPQIKDPNVLNIAQVVHVPLQKEFVPNEVDGNSQVAEEPLFDKDLYQVKKGDTLKLIASRYGITLSQLIELNPQIQNPSALEIGQIINVPEEGTIIANPNVGTVNTNASFYTIQSGDYLTTIAKKLNVSYANLLTYNPQITNPNIINVGQKINVPTEDFVVLSKIIHLESQGEPMEGQIAVGNVIMNRAADPTFPNTIKKVVYQKGQFTPVSNGTMDKLTQPSASSIEAAKRVLEGEVVVPSETLFFFAPSLTDDSFVHSREVVANIGGHRFAK